MLLRKLGQGFVLALAVSTSAFAGDFKLESSDIAEGQILSSIHVFEGFGCEGDDTSPQLKWSGAPEGTKSFAVTAYDPDAPTGSGWWHWNTFNIPANINSLARNASGNTMPKQAIELTNDYGSTGFGGACPPPGEVHRYIFKVRALNTDKLDIPATSSNALAGYMINAHTIDTASITAVYTR